MSDRDDIPRTGSRVSLQEDGCFVCGPSNPIGLRLKFDYDGENQRATSRVTFRAEHQGWDGVVHGGILAAALDDVMAHAIMTTDNLGITTQISIKYRKPVKVGETVFLEGTVLQLKPRVARARGIAYILEGAPGSERVIKCEAEGTYFLDSPKAGG